MVMCQGLYSDLGKHQNIEIIYVLTKYFGRHMPIKVHAELNVRPQTHTFKCYE